MFKKILIANRGEIALRIVRACAEMGIRSAAVYTDPDRYALHVKQADVAYNLGPESVEGYLNVHRIVNLAAATGCDAIHPGYGFLSENPDLPRTCAKRGIAFIGPSSEVIEQMGDKVRAREAMIAAGVPVVPGSDGNVSDVEQAQKVANEVGYPIMLKATNGGGGRGIRRCDNDAELKQNFQRVVSEATKAFGSAEVFIEKMVLNPKHIEVQVMADKHGNTVHLFERDCSIQRRNQKLIEIAPSPQLTQEQRDYVCQLGVKAAQAVSYENAGTVEFLLDQSGEFYFIEMNTRLQVEHPVTESVTGIDIVQEQIRIADGQVLSVQQEDINYYGYAADFRVNAEDPQNDFLPSFGRISRYYAPGGPGVRTDSAIYTGYSIPPYYDSLCAKVTVWGKDWQTVINRAARALPEMHMAGIKTTIPFYLQILQTQHFIDGEFDTGFIDAHPELLHYSARTQPQDLAVVIAAALAASGIREC